MYNLNIYCFIIKYSYKLNFESITETFLQYNIAILVEIVERKIIIATQLETT
jgi:hypothetical protein